MNTNENPSPTADTITLGADINSEHSSAADHERDHAGRRGLAVDESRYGFPCYWTGDFTVNQVTLQTGFATDGGGIYNTAR
ncbi:MAG: hypothetical protein M9941_11350 [Anaerolineae bacterium]|nr:hypothetical protein [Anaerolineae bacterium]